MSDTAVLLESEAEHKTRRIQKHPPPFEHINICVGLRNDMSKIKKEV